MTQLETNMGESSMKLSAVHTIAWKTANVKEELKKKINDQVTHTVSVWLGRKIAALKFTSSLS